MKAFAASTIGLASALIFFASSAVPTEARGRNRAPAFIAGAILSGLALHGLHRHGHRHYYRDYGYSYAPRYYGYSGYRSNYRSNRHCNYRHGHRHCH